MERELAALKEKNAKLFEGCSNLESELDKQIKRNEEIKEEARELHEEVEIQSS